MSEVAIAGGGKDVCVLVPQLNHGGAERQTAIMVEHLATHYGLRPLVCCMSALLEPFGERIRAAGCDLVHWDRAKSFELGRVHFLRRLLRARGIRLLHAVHYQSVAYGWLARLGMPQVAFVPAVRSTVYEPPLVRRAFYRFVLPRCSVVIANSVTGGQWLQQYYGVSKDRVEIVPNGLDPGLLAAAPDRLAVRSRLGIPRDAPLVAFVGKTRGQKGIPLLIRILRTALQRLPEMHVVLMGTGLTPEWVRESFGAHPNLHGLGIRNDVYDVLGSADGLLLTSSSEGFPNTVLEAMALGAPPVATRVGQCPYLIDHGQDGFLFDYDDEVEGSRLLLRLLQETGLKEAMSRRGRTKMLDRYGTKAMVEATLRVYRRALG